MIMMSKSWMAIFMGFILSMVTAGLVIAAQGETIVVSVNSAGVVGNYSSVYHSSISPDGRYVAFQSYATNLVANDTNLRYDIFVHDRQTAQTTRVSVSSEGVQGNSHSEWPSISSDGRYVAFQSWASNLVPNDTNDANDIFVHDRQTGQTTRVSVDSAGVQGNYHSYYPSISSDGRYVTFQSFASNLVANDTNRMSDIFVHDRQTAQTTRVSVSSEGVQGNHHSYNPSISSDGRYLAFDSYASNLVPNDTNGGIGDVFVHDRETGQTTIVSVDSAGMQGNLWSSYPSISSDGRYVAFQCYASNLVPNDTNGTMDILVHDRETGQTTRVSVNSEGVQGNDYSGFPSISPDGRYVAFESIASNLVPNDTNGDCDIFVHDRQTGQTTRVSVSSEGVQGNLPSYYPSISWDGRYVAFNSFAGNLAPNSSNGNIFVHECPKSVTIDIKPGSDLNSINFKSRGKIPVAILSTKDFNALSQIDINSLTFGRTGDERSLAFCHASEDVNRDGLQDLLCHFHTEATGFQCGDTEGILRGETKEGRPIEGSDSVRIIPGKE